eukprot:2883364-Rhodomonas_salina.1
MHSKLALDSETLATAGPGARNLKMRSTGGSGTASELKLNIFRLGSPSPTPQALSLLPLHPSPPSESSTLEPDITTVTTLSHWHCEWHARAGVRVFPTLSLARGRSSSSVVLPCNVT